MSGLKKTRTLSQLVPNPAPERVMELEPEDIAVELNEIEGRVIGDTTEPIAVTEDVPYDLRITDAFNTPIGVFDVSDTSISNKESVHKLIAFAFEISNEDDD